MEKQKRQIMNLFRKVSLIKAILLQTSTLSNIVYGDYTELIMQIK